MTTPRVLSAWLKMLTPQASKRVFEFFDGERHAASIVLDIIAKAGNLPKGFLVEWDQPSQPTKIVITFHPRGSLEIHTHSLSESRWWGKTSRGLPALVIATELTSTHFTARFVDGKVLKVNLSTTEGVWEEGFLPLKDARIKTISITSEGDPT